MALVRFRHSLDSARPLSGLVVDSHKKTTATAAESEGVNRRERPQNLAPFATFTFFYCALGTLGRS